ncbi:hypothetical protein GCM10007276_02010 [Agaricicola taiwanensis]|uniref:Acyclic terpene utilisation N-terminal domain-containing protein n=1 Tax=Agaricicola taiwanensis TaxID=591372 RepID=A0A8J2VJA7_9RHOB|nr:acyclic terpene utilization AtuA family protein [Agaricicola taiwanensis]GGE28414.1 hypothetical protein GCM10007276_02010 [Agaricicola taiwanensis]
MSHPEDEVRVVSPSSVCGAGFSEASFERALSLKPHFIGCDGGSTDPGPNYLGTGKTVFTRAAIKRDLRLMLLGARRNNIPLLIGTAGTAGGKANLDGVYEILQEIAEEEGLSFRLALIHSEQDKEFLKAKFRDGRIVPLKPAPHFDEAVIDRSAHIVGMMGAEPFQKALDAGADVVLAGRASDTAIFASFAMRAGIPPAVAWHAAKILECGAAAVTQRKTPDCMFAWMRKDHFVVEAMDPELRCTPQSIASHALYENADPFRLVECSGTLDLTHARYEQVSDVAVKVTDSAFEHAETYTVKLEGAELVGYQSVLIGSVRDPYIIRQIDDWLARLRVKIDARVQQVLSAKGVAADYTLNVRVYGKNGTMGSLEPVDQIASHEICLLFEATAPSQDLANTIGSIIRHQALHLPIPEWSGLITSIACPYSYLERGAVYRFNVNHVVQPTDPYEMFPMDIVEIDGTRQRRSVA